MQCALRRQRAAPARAARRAGSSATASAAAHRRRPRSPAPCSRRAAPAHARRCSARELRRARPSAPARACTMQASTSSPRTASGVGGHRRRLHRRMLVQHALDLDRRDVLAAAADHVLLAVDEVQVAVGVAPHDVAGVEPAAGPGLVGGRLVLQVAGEEVAPRVGARSRAPAARRARRRRRRCPRRRPARISTNASAPAEAAGADVARLAVGHHAGRRRRSRSSPRPRPAESRSAASNGAWFLRSTPAPKPQRTACSRSCGDGGAASSIAGITPR